MEYKRVSPSESLSPYVKYFWFLDITKEDLPFSQLLLPYGWFELLLGIGNTDIGLYTGQLATPSLLHFNEPFKAAGACLQPWVSDLIFDGPANQFSGSSHSLNDMPSKHLPVDQIREAKSESEIFTILENFFSNQLKNYQLDKVSYYVSNAILTDLQSESLSKILSSVGLSRRRIEQRFLASTGVSMSYFTRIARFEKSLKLLESKNSGSLTQISLESGYYDQAHFIREFKGFSGLTPKKCTSLLSGLGNVERDMMLN